MTRINCIPVKELEDKYLLAEYREMPRISKAARFPKNKELFPNNYKMGTGHVKFFYDKGKYLSNRFDSIVKELKNRGFNLSYTNYRQHPTGLNNDWQPTIDDEMINASRIDDRRNGI